MSNTNGYQQNGYQQPESLEIDDNAPVSQYATQATSYPVESLEVRKENQASAPDMGFIRSAPSATNLMMKSRRKAFLVSGVIVAMVAIIGTVSILLLQYTDGKNRSAISGGKSQDLTLRDAEDSRIPSEIQGVDDSLLVDGDIVTRGTLKVSNNGNITVLRTLNTTGDQSITLPNGSGTVCLDTNNCGYASATQLDALQAELAGIPRENGSTTTIIQGGTDQSAAVAALQSQVNNLTAALQALTQQVASLPGPQPAGVATLNGQNGSLTIQGSTNRISVSTVGGVITISTPQDLDSNANVQFGNLTVGPGGTITANNFMQTAAGQNIAINAGNDMITFTAGGRVFQLPTSGAMSQTICTSGVSCAVGGGTAVLLSQPTAQIDALAEASIFINDTGGGHLIRLQSGAVDRLAVDNSGNTYISGSLTVASLGSGVVKSVGGALSVGNIDLTSEVSGVLPVANGGTGAASLLANGVIVGNGAGALQSVVAGAAGRCLVSTAGAPAFQACPGTGGVASVNGSNGAITIVGTTNQIAIDTVGSTITASLANTTVTPGMYGSGSSVATFTVDATGRLTAASSTSIALNGNQITSGTISNARLDPNIVRYTDTTANFTGSLQQNGEDVCTTAGNCDAAAGTPGSGDISGNGTNGRIALFNGSKSLTTSALVQGAGLLTLDSGSSLVLTSGNLTLSNGNLSVAGSGSFTGRVSGANAVSSNEFVTLSQLNAAVGGVGGGVASINDLAGVLTLQGTSGKVSITDNDTDTFTIDLDASVTLQGNTFNGANQLVQLTGSGALPVLNGANLTNVNAVTLQGQNGSYYLDLTNATGTLAIARIADGSITNSKLQNSSITVAAGTGLSGGGSTALGGSTTLNLTDTLVVPGSYGSASTVATFTVDAQGRLTAAGTTSIALNGNQITSGTISNARLDPNIVRYTDTTANFTGSLQQNGEDVCTTAGNCDAAAGTPGSGDISGNGTNGRIALFNGSKSLTSSVLLQGADSLALDSGYDFVVAGGTLEVIGNGSFTGRVSGANAVAADEFVTLGQLDGIIDDAIVGIGGGVTSIGAIDSQTKNANGAVINGTTLYLQTADASNPGLVSTGAQTFAGAKTFNGSVTIAAQQTLRLVGGTTAQRPGSPSEGTLFYDTDTDRLLVFANGKWQAHSQDAVYVAASNSSQADKDIANFVANGNTAAAGDGDQIEINQALLAGAGKKVILLAGTYVVDTQINVPNNTTLTGVGNGTIIELADPDNNFPAIANSDTVTGTGVKVENMKLNGRADLAGGDYTPALIQMNGIGDYATGRQGATIQNLNISNVYGAGVELDSGANSVVRNNMFSSMCFAIGIDQDSSVVSGNIINNTGYIETLDTIGNCFGPSIAVGGTSNGTVVTNNTITNPGGSTDNNAIMVTDNATGTRITDNTIIDSSATVTNYAISILPVATDTYIADNMLGDASIHDQGTGTIYGGQSVGDDFGIQAGPSGSIVLSSDTTIISDLSVLGGVAAQGGLSVGNAGQFAVGSTGVVTAGTWQGSTIGLAYGGTNNTSYTTNGIVYSNGSALVSTGAGTTGQCLLATTGSAPTWGACTASSLQGTYDASSPATILLTNSKDFTINTGDTAVDSNIIFNLSCVTCSANGGRFAVQDSGVDVFTVMPNGDIRIGTAANNVTFSAASGYQSTASGNARKTKRIYLTPEFTNAVLNSGGCTGSNTGTMTGGISGRNHYYNWTTTEATAQCYEVSVQIPLPSDFDAWATTAPLKIRGWKDNVNGLINVQMIDSAGNTEANINYASFAMGTNTWTQVTGGTVSGTYAANGIVDLNIRITAPQNGNTRLSDITLEYLSKW